MPKTPEQWLAAANPAEKTKGALKLFLGYAPGVGKTFSMLSEAIRRHSRGEDVVIGVVETHGRKGIAELSSQLETIPRRMIDYKGTLFAEMDMDAILARKPRVVLETHGRKGIAELSSQLETIPRRMIDYKGTLFAEMDMDAILARKPRVVLVDELAHTNIPGSRHRKRYEDVLKILEENIDVISTVNIQHIESIAPTVRAITGVPVRETVPDWVLQVSDETVMVDLTPEALQNRMRRGDVYGIEKIEQALKNFFRRGNLIALRELALRQVAEQVDRSLES